MVTTVLEHNSVLRPLYEMEKLGAELVIVGCEKAEENADEEEKNRVKRLGKLDYRALTGGNHSGDQGSGHDPCI